MKILLLGSHGYIGIAINKALQESGLPYCSAPSHRSLDYNHYEKLAELIRAVRPTVIINAAAFVAVPSVDHNEDYPRETMAVNVGLPISLACACEDRYIALLHISTGCLYNGHNERNGWREDDPPQLTFNTGAGVYVGSKELAEQFVRGMERHWICRIRLPFDRQEHPRNLLSKLLKFPKIYDDFNSMTERQQFARTVVEIIRQQIPYGTYHCTNPGGISTKFMVRQMQLQGIMKHEPQWWDHDEFHKTVARTKKSNCLLNTDKLSAALGESNPMAHIGEAFPDDIQHWVDMNTLATMGCGE